MITTVSLNPAIDKTILLTDFRRGEVNRLTQVREDIGGKAINVAKLLNRLTIPVQVCGFLGTRNKAYVEELLAGEKLPCHFLEAPGATRTNIKLVELDRGITTDLNEPGFSLTGEELEKFTSLLLREAAHSDYMVLSGSLPGGLPATAYRDFISMVKPYTKVVLDADKALLSEGLKSAPYLIKPNLQELESAFHKSFSNHSEIIAFCQSLADRYGIELILVSMGDQGSLLITGSSCYQAEPLQVEVKSTVGAGDSMLAGMLYGVKKGMTLPDALAFATACGTLAVTKEGTMSLPLHEIKEILPKVHIHKIV